MTEANASASNSPLAGLRVQTLLLAATAAALLAAACIAELGLGSRGIVAAAFAVVLTIVAAFDLEQRRIPNRIVGPAIAIVLVAQLALFPGEALQWVLGGLGAGAVLFLPRLFKADAIGMGDVKLGVLLGVGLGGSVATALLLGSLASVPAALWIMATQGSAGRHQMIPLGPFLALGGVLALFVADLPGA